MPPRPIGSNKVRIAVIAFVVCISVLFHSKNLFHENRTVPWDFVGYHLPHLVVMHEALERGAFPFWDSYSYCGRPFAANPQTQSFYPPRWLSVATAGSASGLVSRLELEELLHIVFAGLSVLFLARRLGLDWAASSLSAVAYGNGCFFASQLQHVGMVEAGAWLPSIVWAVFRLVQLPGYKNIVLLSGALAVAFLTGCTPASLIIYGSAVLFLLLFLFAARKPVSRTLLFFGIACLISVGIVGFQLIPSIELVTRSVGKYRLDWRETGGGVPWEAFVSLVWPDYYSISDLSKFRLQHEITFSYLFGGFIPLALVGAGIYYVRAARQVAGLLLILILSAIFMLGDRTAVGLTFWQILPQPIRVSYYPQYWIILFSFTFALLAGTVLSLMPTTTRMKWALAAITAGELVFFNSGLPMNSAPYGKEQKISTGSYAGDLNTPAVLGARLPQGMSARFDIVRESEQWVMSGPLLGNQTANGYDPLALERVIQSRLFLANGHRWGALYKVERPGAPMLAAMNVDYLISSEPLPSAAESEWTLVRDSPRRVFSRRNPSSRAHFVASVIRVPEMKDAVAAASDPTWNPWECAIVEEPGAEVTSGLSVGEAKILSYKPGEICLRTSNSGDGFLYVSEAFYPGWRAFVDRRETDIRVADVAFQGIWAAAGTHNIVLRFEPTVFWEGACLSAFTLAAVCVAGILVKLRTGHGL